LVANFGSFDSLKLFTRCGLRPCAAQIRCTLRWLTPAAFAIATLARRFGQRHLDYPLDCRRRQRRLARWAGGLTQQAVYPLGQ
jgi:hypothetical protein